ncbi:MAG: YabP/YqfC family sporulation protein [Clostridia bacterium]|nr:YabP/YqfC family sporulation protein [Clostridia bacterium]
MKNYRKNDVEKTSVAQKLSKKIELPIDVLAGFPQIKITSGRELIVEGRCRLTEYSCEKIGISCSENVITVVGRGLNVCHMDSKALVVSGIICALFFEE